MARRVALFAGAVLAVTVAACTHSTATHPSAAAHTYTGPLYLSVPSAEHPDAGAAGNIVDCRTWGGGAFSAAPVYNQGATADSPEAALQEEGIFSGVVDGLQVAKRDKHRILYVREVHGVVKQAVIVHNGPATEGAGGPGWYVESWAACDASEFPRSVNDAAGLQIWTDAAGEPVATTTIQSSRGPEHCDWQSMTFLELGKTTYVRDPLPGLAEYFAGTYRAHTTLPTGAIDTGYQRSGERLWLSSDRHTAYVGTERDVGAWPREIKPLLCD